MKYQQLDLLQNHYVGLHTPENCQGYIIYLHGGPGSHSAYFERALKDIPAYQRLSYGWVTLDQRGCGRSAKSETPVTHSHNLEDVRTLVEKLQSSNHSIKAILGHSYGARLAYELCLDNSTSIESFILLGRAEDPLCSYKRSLYMDVLILKFLEPDKYQDLLPTLSQVTKPDLELRKLVRKTMASDDPRKNFYWGNYETLKWFEKIKAEINMPDDNEVFMQVLKSFPPLDQQKALLSQNLTKNLLWINGWHDFLMGGDMSFGEKHDYIEIFSGSGHYPHYEEAERFIERVQQFLN